MPWEEQDSSKRGVRMDRSGEAGRRGADVRSDCWVAVELRQSGDLSLDLTSKVDAMYGSDIRQQVREVCAALGIAHAAITIEDQGALPFTIAARLETAVRRADPSLGKSWWPPLQSPSAVASRRERPRRSRLYLPGNAPKFMINAGLHRPDGVILDLEDSVAPAEKDAARVLVRNALRAVDFGDSERMVRINQGEQGLEDLAWVVPHNVHVIVVPKAEHPRQIDKIQNRIERLQQEHGLKQEIYLMPIIESALGAWRALEIATAASTVVALAIGLEDYTADIGAERTLDGRESFWARSQVLNGARAAGVQPLDTVFSDVADTAGLRTSVREAKSLGFVGKGCIHPRQIAVVHEAFAPNAAEIQKARAIVLAFQAAKRAGLGVVALGSKMIDPPVVKRALATVEAAVAAGRLAADWQEESSGQDEPGGQVEPQAAGRGEGGAQ
jgi:citrate lyase subunit beta/citryl-CoA lyase